MMNLQNNDSFLFTQQSLTTFNNCPLKFKKRYMENLKWDNIPEDAIKKSIEKGKNFHLLAQRYFLNVDFTLQEDVEEQKELKKWVDNLKKEFPIYPNVKYLPEYKLRMNSPTIKLEANFDLLLIKDNEIQVWDWKTHSSNKKKIVLNEKNLIESFQTIVYLFILKEEIKLLLGDEIQTNNISMHYWQPDPAEIVAEIIYSDEMHETFRKTIESKIKNIYEYDYTLFNKELFRKQCKKCEFNWLCNRESVDFSAFLEEDNYFENTL